MGIHHQTPKEGCPPTRFSCCSLSSSSQSVSSCLRCDTTDNKGAKLDTACVNGDSSKKSKCGTATLDGCLTWVNRNGNVTRWKRDCCSNKNNGALGVKCENRHDGTEWENRPAVYNDVESCTSNDCNTMDPRNGALRLGIPLLSILFISLLSLAIV